MNTKMLYLREKIKTNMIRFASNKMGRLHTNMQEVLMTLHQLGFWNGHADALEMFGMFGLWHTKDYVDHVSHLDFFELDSDIIKYAKEEFKKESGKIDFYNEDSIAYIHNTEKKYDLVVADTPFGLDVYDKENGLASFTPDLFRVSKENAVIVMNIHSEYLNKHKEIKNAIMNISDKTVSELFFASRNEDVAYLVCVLGNGIDKT